METHKTYPSLSGGKSKKIECCKDCVAPKRHLGCHSTCKEYQEERAEYDESKKMEMEERKKMGRVMGKNEFNMLQYSNRSRSGKRHYIK